MSAISLASINNNAVQNIQYLPFTHGEDAGGKALPSSAALTSFGELPPSHTAEVLVVACVVRVKVFFPNIPILVTCEKNYDLPMRSGHTRALDTRQCQEALQSTP